MNKQLDLLHPNAYSAKLVCSPPILPNLDQTRHRCSVSIHLSTTVHLRYLCPMRSKETEAQRQEVHHADLSFHQPRLSHQPCGFGHRSEFHCENLAQGESQFSRVYCAKDLLKQMSPCGAPERPRGLHLKHSSHRSKQL